MATKSKINWWKVSVTAAIIAAIFLLGRSCGIKSVIKKVGSDTTVTETRIDTFYKLLPEVVKFKDSIVYVPSWYGSLGGSKGDMIMASTDSLPEPTDTAALLRDYNATRFYRDSQNLKRGWVIIEDSVTQNRFASRRLKTFNTDTTIRETTELIRPKKAIVYIGASFSTRKGDVFAGFGWDVSLKTPNDMIYGAGVRFMNAGTFYEAQIKLPIRLKRQ